MGSQTSVRKVLRFGLFEIDLEGRQLYKAGVPVRIQAQPLTVLTLLALRHGEIVSREELQHQLWGDKTFVDFEQGLNYCIRQIRAVLGDEAQTPHYVETIPRRGYRFVASVAEPGQGTTVDGGAAELPVVRWESRLGRWPLGVSLLLLLAALATAWWMSQSTNRPALTEKDSILISEFSNHTGDPVFDGTLGKAVSIDLDQSPYLNVVPDEKIRQVLRLMSKPPDSPVSPEIGREICLRSGTKAMLVGSIAMLGPRYTLKLEVFSAGSGELLAKEGEQAANKEQVLNALGKAADRLRKTLGESLPSIKQFDKPLEQVTTSSLEALQLYTMAARKRSEAEYDSIPYLERAIHLDPNFALAYASLGTVYLNLEQLQLAEDYEKKAIALSDRVSEREKLYITAHYYDLIGQRQKEILTYETYSQLYPRDPLPEANLANEYIILGRFDKSVEHALNALRFKPDDPTIHWELATSYEALGRMDEAKGVILKGLERSPDSSLLHLTLSNFAVAQGDTTTRDKEDAVLRATPHGNLRLLYRDAALAASRGRLHESEQRYGEVVKMALKLGLKDNASFAQATKAVYAAYLQRPADARASAQEALSLSKMSDTVEPAAVALAVAGDERQAKFLIDNLARARPEDEALQFVWMPAVYAWANINRGNFEEAIRGLGPAVPFDRGTLDPMLVRANAFLRAKHAAEAIEEFRRIVNLRMFSPYDPACSLALLGLARAYALAGQGEPSRHAYEQFLVLWKDADPDLPALQQAKNEYKSLLQSNSS